MIRVVALDEETGETIELQGSRLVLLVGDGNHMEMAQVGEANDAEVACEMISEAREKLDEEAESASPPLASTQLH